MPSAAVGLIPPDAVQVSAASAAGQPLARHQITNSRSVADLYTRINGSPTVAFGGGCTLAPPDPVTYAFAFTRWGTTLETAAPNASGCPPHLWTVTRGGWSSLHLDLSGAATRAILVEAGLPAPSSQP